MTDFSLRLLLSLAAVVFAFALSGCATEVVKPAPVLHFTLSASPDVNRDARGQAAPVVVRIYELRARDAFDRATFFELYDHDRQVLDGAAIARTVIVIRPGERLSFDHSLNPNTHSVGILAAYQCIDRAQWRAAVDVSDAQTHTLDADLGPSAVTLVEEKHVEAKPKRGIVMRFVKPVWEALAGAFKGSKQ